MSTSRYTIGIDLGTSNSVLAYVDLLDESGASKVLEVEQVDASGARRKAAVVPSMVFLPPTGEAPIVGLGAKDQASALPGRVIQSAKSWLSQGWSTLENDGRILPWDSEEVETCARLSPVEVSALLLERFRSEWDRTIGGYAEEYRFDRQLITITVPASFDEMAAKLTRDAAELAGFPPNVRLLEEPQAAFYSWLELHPQLSLLAELAKKGSGVATVLVCDVGGGTTDFSLFEIRPGAADGGLPEIRRVAVSDHILLGGDNIDMTLSFDLTRRFADQGTVLGRTQLSHLLGQARQLKERVLGSEIDDDRLHTISLPSVGSGLFRGAVSTTISERDVRTLVVDGFFPRTKISDQLQGVRGGLQERGLPYAKDSAVTRHLAQFLANAAFAKGLTIDGVLFAGGTLTPEFLRQRIIETIGSWQSGVPREIESNEMDLAVARGAAHYGALIARRRTQIRSAYARTLYIEIDAEGGRRAVCVVPRGLEPEERSRLPHRSFELRVGVPVRFQLWYSSIREGDRAGDLVELDESAFRRLPTVEALVPADRFASSVAVASIRVVLEAVITQLGRLEMYFVPESDADAAEHFMLSFELRNELREQETTALQVSETALESAHTLLAASYGKKKLDTGDGGPKRLLRDLERALGIARDRWEVPLLRALWPALLEGITRRGRSVQHEATWLSLAGFFLRPGYGAKGDSARITELWRCYALGMSFPKESSVVVQWWIMWRRVAGGLTPSAQRELFKKLRPLLKEKRSDLPEIFRLAASLEWLSPSEKEELGEAILVRLTGRAAGPSFAWAFGRLATRVQLYASHDQVIQADLVGRWLERLLQAPWDQAAADDLARAAALAARKVGDGRDIDEALRARLIQRMREVRAAPTLIESVTRFVPFAQSDSVDLFGETLPVGLRLVD